MLRRDARKTHAGCENPRGDHRAGAKPGNQDHLVQKAISEATSALMEWLAQGWITAEGSWNADKARVEVARDWYGPFWLVTFTVSEAPWFGDAITVEVEELPGHRFQTCVDSGQFAGENISCCHFEDGLPEGHWRVNPQPQPSLPRVMETSPEERSVDPHGESLPEAEAVPAPVEFARQRPRDLGWANSSHWMEEEI